MLVASPRGHHTGIADRSIIFGFLLHFSICPVSSDTRHYVASGPTIRSVPCAREEFCRREQGRRGARAARGQSRGGKRRLPGGTSPHELNREETYKAVAEHRNDAGDCSMSSLAVDKRTSGAI